MDGYALSYEYLLRRAHKCGRNGVAGANADVYRHFEKAHAEYKEVKSGKPKFTNKSLEEAFGDYMLCCGEVSAYIITAIDKVRKDCKDLLNKKQDSELEQVEILLIKPDIEKIEKSIEKAQEIMMEIGLYPA
jgi:hypothetical protein